MWQFQVHNQTEGDFIFMRINSNRPNLRTSDIAAALSHRLVGQPAAIAAIVPFVEMHRAMLAPEGRPGGVFLLLGPTGTGKTKTVEALADVLHGSPRKLLKVDCGEYQMEHEVAKLLGAPPGYLGHRETQPLLTQQKVNAAASESCDLSIVLFDEIEKAAPTLLRLLLGVLDKATLRLGDNTVVNFEKSLIFLTSNLGAREMRHQLRPDFGFESVLPHSAQHAGKLESIGMAAVRRNFSPEFINRIDSVVTFQPLSPDALMEILDQQIAALEDQMHRRMGERSFHLEVPARTRKFLLERGTSSEYGARELKRTLQRLLIQPLAALVSAGEIRPGGRVRAELAPRRDRLAFRVDLPNETEDVFVPAC